MLVLLLVVVVASDEGASTVLDDCESTDRLEGDDAEGTVKPEDWPSRRSRTARITFMVSRLLLIQIAKVGISCQRCSRMFVPVPK